MQFNLRFLFAATACAAVATYALFYPTPFLAAVSFTLCIGLLMAAILFAVAASGRSRFFWLGFAVFGWGYWLVLHSPVLAIDQTATQNWRMNPEGPPPLLTQRFLVWVYGSVLPLVHAPPKPDLPLYSDRVDSLGQRIRNYTFPTEIEFMRVGHSLCDLLCALIGGVVGWFAFWRYRAARP